MKTLPYSCCPFQSFWRAFLCWFWSAILYLRIQSYDVLSAVLYICRSFFITLNILILLVNVITLLHVASCSTLWPVSSHPCQDVHPWKIKKIIDVIIEIESFALLFCFRKRRFVLQDKPGFIEQMLKKNCNTAENIQSGKCCNKSDHCYSQFPIEIWTCDF